MASIGQTLREARMRQRLDITDVEERTKIRAKYLRALENEEFGMLPGGTFVKTFLRTYAEVLGLDPHQLVEEYRSNYEAGEEMEIQPIAATGRAARERDRRGGGGPPGPIAVVVGAVVAVLALLLVLGLTGNNDDDGSKQAAQATETQKKPAPKKKKPKPKPAPAQVTLQITPNGPVYICVDRGLGGEVLYNSTTSEPQTFKGKKLRVNLGRTAVEVKVNGKPFPIAPAANPVGYEFSPTGSKELSGDQRPTCA